MWGPAARVGEHLDDGLIVPEGRFGWSLAIAGTALGAFFTRAQAPLLLAFGVPLMVIGGALVAASVRALGAGVRVVTHGPYRWVRHPYYLGVLLLLLGEIVALRAWPALVLFLVAVRLTARRARNEEHNMQIEFGPAYDAYAARVPSLLPLAPPLPPGGMTDEQRAGRGLLGTLLADDGNGADEPGICGEPARGDGRPGEPL